MGPTSLDSKQQQGWKAKADVLEIAQLQETVIQVSYASSTC